MILRKLYKHVGFCKALIHHLSSHFYYIFGTTKYLSDVLQWSDLVLAYAVCLISSVESKLSESRSDTEWNRERSRRVTNVPRRLDDCVLTTTTCKQKHQQNNYWYLVRTIGSPYYLLSSIIGNLELSPMAMLTCKK